MVNRNKTPDEDLFHGGGGGKLKQLIILIFTEVKGRNWIGCSQYFFQIFSLLNLHSVL